MTLLSYLLQHVKWLSWAMEPILSPSPLCWAAAAHGGLFMSMGRRRQKFRTRWVVIIRKTVTPSVKTFLNVKQARHGQKNGNHHSKHLPSKSNQKKKNQISNKKKIKSKSSRIPIPLNFSILFSTGGKIN